MTLAIDLAGTIGQWNLNLVYLICLVGGGGYILASFVLGSVADMGHSILDGGGHHGADAGADGGGLHLSFLSPLGLSTFLTGIGAFGLITLHALQMAPLNSVFWSTGLALLLNALVTWMFLTIFIKAQGNTVGRSSQLSGIEAEIIAPISSTSVGQIAYSTPSGRQTAVARSSDGSEIKNGALVKVERFVGSVAIVSLPEPETKKTTNS
ncbi:MAG: hypothetical protein FJX76_00695 [Armatimonadetes bacterium]|nr:hypothetical protein [Armatimonadota bacterium]